MPEIWRKVVISHDTRIQLLAGTARPWTLPIRPGNRRFHPYLVHISLILPYIAIWQNPL
jgi:hypothetical protein